jgi:hypothetical protein
LKLKYKKQRGLTYLFREKREKKKKEEERFSDDKPPHYHQLTP